MLRMFQCKNDVFGLMIMVSLLGHVLILGMSGFFPNDTHFYVNQASNSVEVRMIQEIVTKPLEMVEPVLKPIREKVPEQVLAVAETVKDFKKSEVIKPKVLFQDRVKNEAVTFNKNERLTKKIKNDIFNQVVEPNQGVRVEAKPLNHINLPPRYPQVAVKRGWEGVVYLEVMVASSGNVNTVHLKESSRHSVLDSAARDAVSKWRFEPAHIGNLKFDSKIVVPVVFRLKN